MISCYTIWGSLHWAKYQNRHSSKSIWVMKLFFCQNGPLMGQSFWQNTSLVTHILFDLFLFWYYGTTSNNTYLLSRSLLELNPQKCNHNYCSWNLFMIWRFFSLQFNLFQFRFWQFLEKWGGKIYLVLNHDYPLGPGRVM